MNVHSAMKNTFISNKTNVHKYVEIGLPLKHHVTMKSRSILMDVTINVSKCRILLAIKHRTISVSVHTTRKLF